MRRSGLTALAVAFVLAIAGCGGDGSSDDSDGGPDGAALRAPFNELAAQAYDEAGEDRDAQGGAGVLVEGCFVIDDEAASAIGAAADIDELTFIEDNFLQGVPDQEERLLCGVEKPDGTDGPPPIVNIGAGTTTLNRDQLLARLLNSDDAERHEVEGEADGLDPSTTLAAEGGGVSQYAWVDGDFTVGLAGPSDQLPPDKGFAALSAAVEGVQSTLLD
jgi:hypothetical protein